MCFQGSSNGGGNGGKSSGKPHFPRAAAKDGVTRRNGKPWWQSFSDVRARASHLLHVELHEGGCTWRLLVLRLSALARCGRS